MFGLNGFNNVLLNNLLQPLSFGRKPAFSNTGSIWGRNAAPVPYYNDNFSAMTILMSLLMQKVDNNSI